MIFASIERTTIIVMSYDEYKRLMEREAFGEAARYAEEQAEEGGGQEEFWLTQQAKAVNREGGYTAALEIARRALDLAPSNPYALAAAADALLALKRYREALEYYEEIADHPRLLRQGRRGVLESLAGLKSGRKSSTASPPGTFRKNRQSRRR